MSWAMVAAAALPYVVGMLQPKPKSPQYQAPNVQDLTPYNKRMLDAAFNPNSAQYRLASEQVAENVNRALARQGLAGSSPGMQLAALSQNQLAQSFIDNQLQRQQMALGTVNDWNRMQMGAADAAYTRAGDQYNRQLAGQQASLQGLGAIANVAANQYGQSQAQSKYDERRLQDQQFMRDLYGAPLHPAQPSYGVPGPMPSYPTPAPYSPAPIQYSSPYTGGYGY